MNCQRKSKEKRRQVNNSDLLFILHFVVRCSFSIRNVDSPDVWALTIVSPIKIIRKF